MSVPDSAERPADWPNWPNAAKRSWLSMTFKRASLLSRILGRAGLPAEGVDGRSALSKKQLAGIYTTIVDIEHHPDYGPGLTRLEDDQQRYELARRESRESLVTMLLNRAGMPPRDGIDYSKTKLTKNNLAAIYILLEVNHE